MCPAFICMLYPPWPNPLNSLHASSPLDVTSMADAMARGSQREATLSICLAWPFVRALGGLEDGLEILEREGVGLAQFGDPDTRLRHSAMIDLLEHTRALTGDPALGLRAAGSIDPGDFGALEPLIQSCRTLREGLHLSARYVQLLNEAARITLEEGEDVVVWRWETVDSVPQPAAANDFIVAAFLRSWQRHTGLDEPPLEVHLAHVEAGAGQHYAATFRCPVKLGMPHNAVLLRSGFVEAPMVHANRSLNAAFERHAQSLLMRLRRHDSTSNRTRAIVVAELQSGDPSMESVARKLGMSTATLRRRLDEEGTTHRQILDEVRSGLAKRYLREGKLSIREVSALLGFAHVTAFYKAFRRWSGGGTPASFRGRPQRLFGLHDRDETGFSADVG